MKGKKATGIHSNFIGILCVFLVFIAPKFIEAQGGYSSDFIDKLEAEEHIKRGKEFFSLEMYHQAEWEFKKALEKHNRLWARSDYIDLRYNLALIHMRQGLYREAMEELEPLVLKNAPLGPKIYYNLAVCYYSVGRYREAKEWSQRVLKVDPKYIEAKRLFRQVERAERMKTERSTKEGLSEPETILPEPSQMSTVELKEERSEPHKDAIPTEINTPVRIFNDEAETRLNVVNFGIASASLDLNARRILDQIVVVLERFPELNLEISGYTDSTGSANLNLKLSRERASSVRDYLISQGIAFSRLVVRGYGEEGFVADNATHEGRALNRRVELHQIGP